MSVVSLIDVGVWGWVGAFILVGVCIWGLGRVDVWCVSLLRVGLGRVGLGFRCGSVGGDWVGCLGGWFSGCFVAWGRDFGGWIWMYDTHACVHTMLRGAYRFDQHASVHSFIVRWFGPTPAARCSPLAAQARNLIKIKTKNKKKGKKKGGEGGGVSIRACLSPPSSARCCSPLAAQALELLEGFDYGLPLLGQHHLRDALHLWVGLSNLLVGGVG